MAHDLECITEFSMEPPVHMEMDQHRCRQPPTLTQPLGRHQEERQRLTPWARMEQTSLVRGCTPDTWGQDALLDQPMDCQEDTRQAMRDKVIRDQSMANLGTPEHRIMQQVIKGQAELIMILEDMVTAEQRQPRRR